MKYDKAATKIDSLGVVHLPNRKQPVLVAVKGERRMVLGRFLTRDKSELFLALVRRGMEFRP